MEGKEWVWANGILREQQVAEIKSEIDNSSRIALEEASLKAFERFLSAL
jgi:hypothetical protein